MWGKNLFNNTKQNITRGNGIFPIKKGIANISKKLMHLILFGYILPDINIDGQHLSKFSKKAQKYELTYLASGVTSLKHLGHFEIRFLKRPILVFWQTPCKHAVIFI